MVGGSAGWNRAVVARRRGEARGQRERLPQLDPPAAARRWSGGERSSEPVIVHTILYSILPFSSIHFGACIFYIPFKHSLISMTMTMTMTMTIH